MLAEIDADVPLGEIDADGLKEMLAEIDADILLEIDELSEALGDCEADMLLEIEAETPLGEIEADGLNEILADSDALGD